MTDEHDSEDMAGGAILERWGKPALPFLVLGAALMLGVLRGPGAGVLGFAAGILVLAISMLWSSLRMLLGEAPISLDSAVAMGAILREDEKKRAILRAIKDLEIEHGLGKITDEDFRDLSAQYRAEAKRILREIDERMEPARKKAEELIAAHLMKAAPDPPDHRLRCRSCETPNEADAVFCKQCGARIPTTESPAS